MSTTIDLGKLRFNWVGEWVSSTQYEVNDLVRFGGDVYVYIYGLKTSGNVTTDTVYWALVQEGLSWQGEYAAGTAYKIHEVVHHANNAYVCILSEPAAGNEPPDSTYWQILATGIKFEGSYDDTTAYQVDDIVYYGANTFICVANSAGGNLPSDPAYWATFSHGLDWKGVYNNTTAYKKSDIVSLGGNTFVAKSETVGNDPTDDVYWEIVNSSIRSKGVWGTATAYSTDDVVSYGGQTYIALAPHASSEFATELAAAKWQKFSGGIDWKGNWTTTTFYKVNDLVNNGGVSFIAKADHTSTDFASDQAANWATFVNAGTDVSITLTSHGDILYRGASGPEALNAGNAGQLLISGGVNANPSWVDNNIAYEVITADTTAVSGQNFVADTSAGAFELTFPATPADNDLINISDAARSFKSSNLIIKGNGNNVSGFDNLNVDVDGAAISFLFKTGFGWLMI
jgi:hypothetical protein